MGDRLGLIATARRLGIFWAAATSPAGSERPVEVERRADQGKVREGLGEVAQCLAAGPDLLRVESQVVGVAEHLLEDESGLRDPSRA